VLNSLNGCLLPPTEIHSYNSNDTHSVHTLMEGGNPNAQAADAVPTVSHPLSRFEKSFSDVLKFLYAVGQTPAPASGTDITDSFRETFSKIAIPIDPEKLHAFVQQLTGMPGGHLAAILSAVNETTRQYFNKIVLQLSEDVRKSMPELGETVSILRLLMTRLLPAVAFLPEDSLFDTSATVGQNFSLTDRVAQMIRPDETNPKLTSQIQRTSEVTDAYTQIKRAHDALSSRMKTHGFDVEDESIDASIIQQWKSSNKTTIIILGVIVAILLLAIIVLVVVVLRRKPAVAVGESALNVSAPALGGTTSFHFPVHTPLKYPYDNLE